MQQESVFWVFPNLPVQRLYIGCVSSLDQWRSPDVAPLPDLFVDFTAETHNMIPVGRRLGGFLIFWP